MSTKRMFNVSVVNSDAFFDLALQAQALYFHLAMRADDEGFVENPRTIRRMAGASEDAFKSLVSNGYLIEFPSGVVVITHWRIHNTIQADRKKETIYQKELRQLTVVDGLYKLLPETSAESAPLEEWTDLERMPGQYVCKADPDRKQNGYKTDTVCIQTGSKPETDRKQTGSRPERTAAKADPQIRLDIDTDKIKAVQVRSDQFSSVSTVKAEDKAEGKKESKPRAPAREESQGIQREKLEEMMADAGLPEEARAKVRAFDDGRARDPPAGNPRALDPAAV